MRIDAHQHFWVYEPSRHAWINDDMKEIRRDFLPEQLAPLLRQHGIDGCVTVQVDQTEEETTYLTGLADRHDFIKGVVGWVDLMSPYIEDRLDYFSQFKSLKGFRHIAQSEPDEFLLQQSFGNGISRLAEYGFTYDILIYEHQLPAAVALVKQFPEQPFVIDHIAKPRIKDQVIEPWKKYMKQIASFDNVYCKVSGMVTEASWNSWREEDIRPYLDVVLETFGPQRLMYGSDWPVCLVAADYNRQLGLITRHFDSLSPSEKQMIMGENATRFYHL